MDPPHYTIRTLTLSSSGSRTTTSRLSSAPTTFRASAAGEIFRRILSEYGVTVYPRKGYDVDSIKRQLIEECKDFPAPYVLDSEEIVPDGMRSLEETLIRSYNIEVIDAPIVDISLHRDP